MMSSRIRMVVFVVLVVGVPSGCQSLRRQAAAENARSAQSLSRDLGTARRLVLRAQDERSPDVAIQLYQEAVAAYRGLPVAWNDLGVVLLEQGKRLEAANAFVIAADLDQHDPRAVYNLGLVWERTRRYDDALEHYLRALTRDPQHGPSLRGAIRSEKRLGLVSDEVLARVQAAVMVEHEPAWLAYFERRLIEVRALLRARQEGSAASGASDAR